MGDPERFCTPHMMFAKRVPATAVCKNAEGLQWYACDLPGHRLGAVHTWSMPEWWALVEASAQGRGRDMQCFRCSRTQLDRSQAPHGLTEADAEAIGWRRVVGEEREWLCPFCASVPTRDEWTALAEAADGLLAAYLAANRKARPSTTLVIDVIAWARHKASE